METASLLYVDSLRTFFLTFAFPLITTLWRIDIFYTPWSPGRSSSYIHISFTLRYPPEDGGRMFLRNFCLPRHVASHFGRYSVIAVVGTVRLRSWIQVLLVMVWTSVAEIAVMSSACHLPSRGFLTRSFFDREDWGGMFRRNVCSLWTDYTAQDPRILYAS